VTFIRLTLLVAVCLLAGQANAGEPRYAGPVTPIVEPIVVRYQPHPPAKMEVETTNRVGPLSVVSTVTGASRVIEDGADLIMRTAIDSMAIVMDGKTEQKPLDLAVSVKMTRSGKFIDLAFEGEAEGADPQSVAMARSAVQQMLVAFPDTGVTSGGILFDVARTLPDADEPIPVSLKGTVVGAAVHAGRPAIVTDVGIRLGAGDDAIAMTGYWLVDQATGALLYAEMVSDPDPLISVTEIRCLHMTAPAPGHPAPKGGTD